MNDYEFILSPCQGVVEEIFISKESRIYEWDTLFTIRSNEGETKFVSRGISGSIQSLEVNEGEEVFPGMVLAYIEEDLVASGSD